MPVPIEFLRGMLGVLCLFFSWMMGRAIVRARRDGLRGSRLSGWVLRIILTLLAIAWRHGFDAVLILTLILAAAAAAGGAWSLRPKPQDDTAFKI